MSFLTRLIETRTPENPATPITWQSLASLLGGTPATTGKLVNPSTALQLTAVYACVTLLSETFGSLPMILYKRMRNGRERAEEHPLYPILHDSPNDEITSIELRSMMMAHDLLWGRSYAEIVRNGSGNVKSLWPISPNRVKKVRNARNELVYEVNMPGEPVQRLRADRVLDIGAPLELSPIALARESLGLSMAAEEFGAQFFANGSRPSGIVEHPGQLSGEAQLRLRDQIEEQTRGLSSAHRLLLLEEGMKWHQTGLAPEDSQFLETRKFQTAEIARLFRVPPHMIGDVERSTSWGTGIEQQNIGFITYSLSSWLVRWEQRVKKSLLTATERKVYYPEFLLAGLLRGDYKTRQEGLAIQRQNGVINGDEWREIENMNAIPGGKGKIYLVNAAMTPVDQAGAPSSPPAPLPKNGEGSEEEDEEEEEDDETKP